jgi:Domain of unknown function (DUF4276)
MPEVLVLCEGKTERNFCTSVLARHLNPRGVYLKTSTLGSQHGPAGGVRKWERYRLELERLGNKPNAYVGLLIDYYAMPNDWPGKASAQHLPAMLINDRGTHVEHALEHAMKDTIGSRFIPCVQLHEFESLLFVQPHLTAVKLIRNKDAAKIERLKEAMNDILIQAAGRVQLINDRRETSPAKRIANLVPGFDKITLGLPAVQNVPLDLLRQGCPWLDRWLGKLETLAV